MGLGYAYPEYEIDFTHETVLECVSAAVRLLDEVGFRVPHERFLIYERAEKELPR